jgi:hypothetical protein
MTITTGARALALALTLVCPLAADGRQQTAAADRLPENECAGEEIAPRVVRVKIYNQSRMSARDIDAFVDVANRIWVAYGVSLQPQDDPDAVAVVLSNRRDPRDEAGPIVLGTTLFAHGHATPYINLSLAAAQEVAAGADDGGPPFGTRPQVQQNAIVVRILGVALAHEMGHYLLDTATHSSAGLLKRGLPSNDMARAEPARLQLTAAQRHLLCPAPGMRRP